MKTNKILKLLLTTCLTVSLIGCGTLNDNHDENHKEDCTHLEVEVIDLKEATCTEEGYTGDKKCKECQEIIEDGITIDKLNHEYIEGKCSKCGKEDTTSSTVGNTGSTNN